MGVEGNCRLESPNKSDLIDNDICPERTMEIAIDEKEKTGCTRQAFCILKPGCRSYMDISRELQEAIKAAENAIIEAGRTDHIYGVRNGAGPIAPWPAVPCKLVFLDFDGVLNSEQSVLQLGTRYRFSKGSVTALNEILKQSDARIVITSSWRNHWTLIENAGFLKRDGVVPNRVVGKTKTLEKERGLEVDAWLRSAPYTVESFVILDDRDDMLMHRDRLVLVNPEVGLTMSQARQAIGILASPWKH